MGDGFTRDQRRWLLQMAEDATLPASCSRLAVVLALAYALLAAGELESFKDGKITMSSIKARIARRLAAEADSATGPWSAHERLAGVRRGGSA